MGITCRFSIFLLLLPHLKTIKSSSATNLCRRKRILVRSKGWLYQRKLQAEYICLNYRFLWSGYLKLASRGGQHVYAFTVNKPKIANRLSKYGLSGIITDYPDRFLK